jgi:effector-binding domain-containing protein
MEIRTVEERETLMVRTTASVGELPNVMGSVYGEIAGFMGEKGLKFAGPPFALYHNMDMEALDLEIGFPISNRSKGEGLVTTGRIPGGRVAVAIHTESYDTIGKTYESLAVFVKEKGLETGKWTYEYYLNSPQDTAPDELQTEIYFPIVD